MMVCNQEWKAFHRFTSHYFSFFNLVSYFYRLTYLFIHMHLFSLKNSIDWFHNIYNCAFLICSFFLFFQNFILFDYTWICRNSRIDIQSQIYRNTNNQSLPYYLYIWLTSSWSLSNHRSDRNIDNQSLLYIWLTSSWPLSNHSSMRTLTSNRCIVTLHLANFIVTLIQSQFYRNIDIQSTYIVIFSLTLSWFLSNLSNLSKHWHTIDISLLYIRLILSWHFSKHRSIDTSNRYIVTFWLILSSSNHTSIETLISNQYIVILHLTNFIIYTQIP